MNYNHSFHAGNFADVFKHIVLSIIIKKLQKKDKPFCYIDTHAGYGIYNLLKQESNKDGIKESSLGIQLLIENINNAVPIEIVNYINLIENLGFPNKYPGSPLIASQLLRPIDKVFLYELNSDAIYTLSKLFQENKKVTINKTDGFVSLKANLPPRERRGLIFIDPPYEKNIEWQQIIESLKIGLNRFNNGVYAIWYPYKDLKIVNKFIQNLSEITDNLLITELSVYPSDANLGLLGSGMAIINPPWQIDTELSNILPFLWNVFSINQKGHFKVEWHKK